MPEDTPPNAHEGILFQRDLTEALRTWQAGRGPRHLCVSGPAGCGQALAARNMARVRSAHEPVVVKVLPGDLAVRQPAEAIDRLRERWAAARGGVLRLVMLETLLADQNAVPLLQALRDLMVTDETVTVMLSGDRESIAQLHALSPELYLRLAHTHVTAFTTKQLVELIKVIAAKDNLSTEPKFKEKGEVSLRGVRGVGDLANGRLAAALVRQATATALADGRRFLRVDDIDTRPLRTIESDGSDPMAELDRLIGLGSVKETVRQWVANASVLLRREQLGLSTAGMGQHMVFLGPAGTAKTTVARIVGRILADTGVLSSGHMVETQRADLVGEDSEATSRRVIEAVKRSLGGVLFVDEIYSLTSTADGGRDASREVVDTLLKLMEDYRDEFVVVVAGYTLETEQFLNSNPGLRSRFVRMLEFPAYEQDDLLAILDALAQSRGFVIDPGVHEALRPDLRIHVHHPGFGNGRHMRNLLEMAIVRQASRLTAASTDDDLRTLLASDFSDAPPPAPADLVGLVGSPDVLDPPAPSLNPFAFGD